MKTLLLILLFSCVLIAGDTLLITVGSPEGSFVFRISQRYIQELNSRLDASLHLELIYRPYGRAAIDLCSGRSDGDFVRTDFVYGHCPNVVKVPVSILSDYYYAYCRESYHDSVSVHPDSSTRYISTLGNRAAQHWKEVNNTPGHEVLEYSQALQMISLGRADCLISSNAMEADTLMQSLGITRSAEPIFETDNYLFLNIIHEEHVGQLTRIIYDLNQEEFLSRLLRGEIPLEEE